MRPETTPLDRVHHLMEAAPDSDRARLRFYEAFAETELVLLLDRPAEDAQIAPSVQEIGGAPYVLAFDAPERLTAFTGQASPYAGLSGRMLVQLLKGQEVGLALNPDVAPSATLIAPETIIWLSDLLGQAPEETSGHISELRPPAQAAPDLLAALDRRLARAAGLAREAWLAEALREGGESGLLLAFVDAADGAENALAASVNEALSFLAQDGLSLDVTFLGSAAPALERLKKVGLKFEMPRQEAPARTGPKPPGMDPDTPPKLR